MCQPIHFLNGSFVQEDKLLISPRDLGFIRGYAVADFIVTYHNKPFKLKEHIDRLFKSVHIINLSIPWNKEQIASWVQQTLNKNDKNSEKTIKIIISGGVSDYMQQAKTPTLVMIVNQRVRHPESSYKNGIKAKAIPYKRPFPEAKHTHYVEAIKELSLVKQEGIKDIIYYDNTQVFEGSGCNVFAVMNNQLLTPKTNIVKGITRNTLLEILELPIPIKVQDFTFDQLLEAQEVFLTGSNSEVRGVIEIHGTSIGNGSVGPITKEVIQQYRRYTAEISL